MKETTELSEQALLRRLAEGVTGRLSTSSLDGSELDLYLMSGELLAAHASDDEGQLLQRLLARRLISVDDAERLLQRVGDGPISDLLFDQVDETLLVELLFDRFKENIARFLLARAPASFESMDAIFVANLHVSHNTTELLSGIQELLARTEPLWAETVTRPVARSVEPASPTPAERALYDILMSPHSLDELVFSSPYERFETLDVINDMLESGNLVLKPEDPRSEPFMDMEEAETLPPDVLELTDEDIVEIDAEPSPDAPNQAAPATTVDGFDHTRMPAEGLFTFQREGDVLTTPEDQTLLDLAGFSKGPEDSVFEQELSAFGDYDYVRGGHDGSGHFVHTQDSESTTLDRVDLSIVFDAPASEPPPEDDDDVLIIETPEADEESLQASISMNFTGPQMSNSEAGQKIGVLNEVLVHFATAFDAHGGRGLGASRVQLLLDGSPSEFSTLFHELQAKDSGEVSERALLANLRRRPPAEHRRLLDRGILDLIERALTAAFDTLSDDGIESFLENIAGYQQRMRQAGSG